MSIATADISPVASPVHSRSLTPILDKEKESLISLDQRIKELAETIFPLTYVFDQLKGSFSVGDKLISAFQSFKQSLFDASNTPNARDVDIQDVRCYLDVQDLREAVLQSIDYAKKIVEDKNCSKKNYKNLRSAFSDFVKQGEKFLKDNENIDGEIELDPVRNLKQDHLVTVLKINQLISETAILEISGNHPVDSTNNILRTLSQNIDQVRDEWGKKRVRSKTIEDLFADLDGRFALEKLNADYIATAETCKALEEKIQKVDTDYELADLIEQVNQIEFNHKAIDSAVALSNLNSIVDLHKHVMKGKLKADQQFLDVENEIRVLFQLQIDLNQRQNSLFPKSSEAEILTNSAINVDYIDKISEGKVVLNLALLKLEKLFNKVAKLREGLDPLLQFSLGVFRYARNGQDLRFARKSKATELYHKRVYQRTAQLEFEELEKYYLDNLVTVHSANQASALLMKSLWNKIKQVNHEIQNEIETTRDVIEKQLANPIPDINDHFPGIIQRNTTWLASLIGIG